MLAAVSAGRVPVSGGVNSATSFSYDPPSHRYRREMVAENGRRRLRPSLSNAVVSVKRRVCEQRKRLGHRANRSRGVFPPPSCDPFGSMRSDTTPPPGS